MERNIGRQTDRPSNTRTKRLMQDKHKSRGVHPPEAMMHFPLFQISPYFRKLFQTPWKIFTIWPFPKKIFDFHLPKFLMTFFFFSHWPQIWNFPLFSLFQYISPYFGKFFFPLLLQISPWFRKIYVFFTYFMCFSFPPTLTMMHLCITQCT